MWFGRAKHPKLWEVFPRREADRVGHLDTEQRRFILKAFHENHKVSKRERRRWLAEIQAAAEAGHVKMADEFLDASLGFHGQHVERVIHDETYWEEYQRVMLRQRVDKFQYLFGRPNPFVAQS